MKHLTTILFLYIALTLQSVRGTFCSQIGLLEACAITLKISMKKKGSWRVAFKTANTYGYINGPGWRKFCLENEVKEGDRLTFNAIETTVWHVVIVHC